MYMHIRFDRDGIYICISNTSVANLAQAIIRCLGIRRSSAHIYCCDMGDSDREALTSLSEAHTLHEHMQVDHDVWVGKQQEVDTRSQEEFAAIETKLVPLLRTMSGVECGICHEQGQLIQFPCADLGCVESAFCTCCLLSCPTWATVGEPKCPFCQRPVQITRGELATYCPSSQVPETAYECSQSPFNLLPSVASWFLPLPPDMPDRAIKYEMSETEDYMPGLGPGISDKYASKIRRMLCDGFVMKYNSKNQPSTSR